MGFLAALPAIIGGAGSLFGGLFGGAASGRASKQYIQALQKAQGYLQGEEQRGLSNYSPYLNLGANSTGTLAEMLGTPGQGLLTPWNQQFTAPTAAQAEQTPGYQFQLKAGLDAAQNSAAGRGGLLSGGTLAGLNNYAQGVASTNYGNRFNEALTQYQSAYNTFRNNQNDAYSRLMGASGQGLQAAGGAGNLISNIGGDVASLYGQQGAAAAQGTIGQANAYSSIFPNLYGVLNNMNWPQSTNRLDTGGPSMIPGAGPDVQPPNINFPPGAFPNLYPPPQPPVPGF